MYAEFEGQHALNTSLKLEDQKAVLREQIVILREQNTLLREQNASLVNESAELIATVNTLIEGANELKEEHTRHKAEIAVLWEVVEQMQKRAEVRLFIYTCVLWY